MTTVPAPGGPGITEDELVAAVRAGTPQDDLTPVATPAQVAAVEAELGFRVPRFLRRLYTEVSNGGFRVDGRPVVSLTPVDQWFCDFEDVLDAHRSFTGGPGDDPDDEEVPAGLVPVVDRGCCMWTLVDFRTPEGRVWDWDGNECCRLAPTTITSVEQLFADGLAGRPDGAGPRGRRRLHKESCRER